jgi:cytochrome c-type biogenesis protein
MFEIAGVGILTAFVAGVISFLSPCVLPLVPGYISYVAGETLDSVRAPDSARSKLLLTYKYEANIVGGIIVILFGLFLTGIFNPAWFQRDVRFHADIKGGRPLAAYVLGLAFAFGWTPCVGPVLGAILTMSATSTTTASGVALLSVYSLGLGLPFLLAALFTDTFMSRMKAMRKIGRPLQIAAGVILIIMGIAMATGQLSVFAYWLLKTFPGLATIG